MAQQLLDEKFRECFAILAGALRHRALRVLGQAGLDGLAARAIGAGGAESRADTAQNFRAGSRSLPGSLPVLSGTPKLHEGLALGRGKIAISGPRTGKGQPTKAATLCAQRP